MAPSPVHFPSDALPARFSRVFDSESGGTGSAQVIE